MDIAVVGPGAMGLLLSALLREAGHDVVLVDKDAGRADRVSRAGVTIEGIGGKRTLLVPVTADPDKVGPRSLVLVCVKAYDTKSVCDSAWPLVGNDSMVLTLQNGLGNVEVLAEAFGERRVLGGTTAHGATTLDLGRVRHAGEGDTVIGAFSEASAGRLEGIVEVFRAAGFYTRATGDIEGLLWSKLIVNVGINALTALLRVPNGHVAENDHCRAVMKAAVEEAVFVAGKKGVKLLHDDPVAAVVSVAEKTAANRSSMLQDVLAGRRTEIDAINGAIVCEATGLGVDVPVNRTLTRLIGATTELSGDRIARSLV